MMRTILVLAAIFVAQDPTASWSPATPLQGSLVRVAVPAAALPDDTTTPAGSLAGEPLHFGRDAAGGWTALAAVPLAATDSVVLWLRGPGGDSVGLRVPVALRPTGVDRLTIDSTFTQPLDSALAERVRRETARVVASLWSSHERPRLWTEPFRPPRPTRVTSPFGRGRSYNAADVRGRHRGTDFAGDRGDPVRAANRGVVVLADTLFFAGRSIYVDHGAGVVTAYLHLDRSSVAEGDTVARGQVIGRVGATGRVTGPHLHWAAFFGRVVFDPLDLLALDPRAIP
ncbi:MAG TPA: M23 family metallopeptidase [Gemmatimonadales bacterium]|jgi:murein DD-endopeptidase MepM/ murein hydrolase activator NlpD|nr:M23 family metallopeptidase [Gemmatimonadales bacterium]